MSVWLAVNTSNFRLDQMFCRSEYDNVPIVPIIKKRLNRSPMMSSFRFPVEFPRGNRIWFRLKCICFVDPKGSDAVVTMTAEEAWMERRKRRVPWPKWPDEEPAKELRAHLAASFGPRVARTHEHL